MVTDFSDVQSNVKNVQNVLEKLKLPDNLKNNFANVFKDFEKESEKYQKFLNSGFKTKGDVTGLEKSGERVSAILDSLTKQMTKLTPDVLAKAFVVDPTVIEQTRKNVERLKNEMQQVAIQPEAKKSIDEINEKIQSLGTKSKFAEQFKQAWAVGDINRAREALHQLTINHKRFSDGAKEDQWGQTLKTINTLLDGLAGNTALGKLAQESEVAEKELKDISNIQLQGLLNFINSAIPGVKNMGVEFSNLQKGILQTASSSQRLANELDTFKNRIQYFFGLTNSVMLFRRAIRSAYNSIKELDKVMTETAVVTNFTVGDMWEKLPIYSKQATALGASIKDLYGATTLYYQQGLQTNDAMSVGVETMKMARIANMDATEATTAMTAALRGFNMEVNEMNAQRVNDVYSELAAITAADTNQIATAMSKTASIASSANMEFETTAALLAQIIETTQEAPETAGTAMKTIIARFTEVKQLFSEGMLTGKDDEGEEININKIDAALKSVGISLKDFLNGTKGIDDIFLELASKWDTLDLATQRYIATTAAGSRQQSRFIAMMSNYDRTMELVGAANNSAGASQEQFNKTLESLDAKLQKLKNAWDQFVMGLANNEVIKLGVDVLTGILETVNKLTESLSGGNGLIKSIVSLASVIGALKGGASIFNSLFGYKKQIGEIDLGNGQKGSITLGKMSKKTQAEGEEAAAGLAFGLQKGIKQWQSNGLGAALKGFFGEEITTNVTEAYQQIDSKKLYNALGNMELGLAEDDLSQRAMDVRLLNEQIADGTIDIDIATKKYKEFGGNLEDVIVQTKAFSFNFQNIGVAAAGAGSAISLLGNLFEKLGAEDLGKGLKMIGSGITGIGSTMAMVAPLLTKLGIGFNTLGLTVKGTVVASFSALGTAIAPVAIGLAAIIGLFIAIRNASPEYQLKQATEAANKTAEAADAAAEAYNNLKSSLESIEGKEAALEELTVGTQEWKNAVSELNDEILNLLALYPELSSFVTSDDGILSLSEEGRKFVLDQQYQQKQNTQAANVAAQITKQQAQQAVEFSDLNNQLKLTKIIDIKDEYGNITEQVEVVDREATELLAKELAAGRLEADSPELAFLKDVEGGFEEFLEFGRSLNNIDKAIDVFTDSLMNSAVVNADVSEEFKKQIGGMYDTQAVTKLTQDEQNLIGALSKDEKEEYARRMGYTHKSGNQYIDAEGNQFKVTAQQVKSQLAAMRAQDQLTENIVNMESVFAKLQSSSNTLEKSFANVISKADGAGLTLSDLTQNANVFEGTYEQSIANDKNGNIIFSNSKLQELYNKVSDSYDPETFYRIFSDAYKKAEQRQGQVASRLSSIELGALGRGDLFSTAKIDTGSLFDIANELYDIFIISGQEATTQVAETINSLMEESPEQAQAFADALKLIDWTSVDSIKSLDQVLSDMNVSYAAADIEKLENEILTASQAARNFSLEKVREELKFLGDIIKELKGRDEIDRTFNEKQKNDILEQLPEISDQFIMTNADEYIFIGESIEELIKALEENTQTRLEEIKKSAIENANKSRDWEALMSSNDLIQYSQLRKSSTGGLINTTESATYADIISKINAGESVRKDVIVEILEQLGESTEGSIEVLRERVKELYNKYYIDREKNYSTEAEWKNTEEQQRLSKKTSYELEGMIQEDGDQTVLENNQKILEIMQAQAIQAGITAAEIEYYKTALADSGKAGDKLEAAAISTAIALKKQQNAINKASENIGKYLSIMDDAEEGSVTYNEALAAIPEQLKKAFGVKPSIEWLNIDSNLQLVKDWAAGSEEAGAQIQQNLLGSFSSAIAECEANVGQSVSTMIDWLNSFSGTSVWANAYLDNSGFMNAITESAAEAEALADFLRSKGYETYIETVYEPQTTYYPTLEKGPGGKMVPVDKPITTYIPHQKISWKPTNGNGWNFNAPSNYSSKGSGGGSSDKWSNPYDKQYNNNEKLNEEFRTRNKLEREYQKLLDSTNTKASDLVSKSQEQLESLEREKAIRKEILSGRQKEMAAVEKKYNDLSEYASYNEEKQIIEINWKKINELDGSKDEKLTSRIEEYIAALEKAQSQIDEQTDAIANIDENVKEIRDRGKDEYRDLENQIRDAIESSRQKEIDELVAINESINNTNTSLIESIQTVLDKQRQERENERTEEDWSNKQRRLAYLQQDTSGANQMEILRLQKEIEEGQEDYTDSLIDQKINELQQQNDIAAEQRQYQIDLMQSQLEQYMESGRVWQDVYQLMTYGIGPSGIIAGSELEKLLMESANFRAMSEIEKMNWLKELEDNVAKAVEWLKIGNSTSSLKDQGDLKKGDKVTFTTADNKTLTGKVNSKGQVVVDGQVYEGVYRNFDGNYVTDENYKKPKKEPSSDKPTTPAPEPETEKPKKPKLTDKIKRGVSAAIWNGNYGWGSGDTRKKRLKEVFGENDIQNKYVDKSITSGYDGHVSDYSYANMKKKFLQYKTGGLADFTGPAWLDGTKSRPEYVLNADQTKSFFRLVDVLSGLKSGPISNSQNNGDITYDIDINVESIGNDYDVEQLADKVKGLINDTARYRTNNTISIKR